MTRRSDWTKIQQGYSLIEVMIAAALLGGSLIALGQLQGSSLKDSALAKQRQEASNLAQAKLEELRGVAGATNYNALAAKAEAPDPAHTISAINGSALTVPYTLNWTVAPTNGGRSLDVNVRATWPDPRNGGTASANTTISLGTVVSGIAAAVALNPNIIPPADDPYFAPIVCNCDDSSRISGGMASLPGPVRVGGMDRGSVTTALNTNYCSDCCTAAKNTTQSGGGMHNMKSTPLTSQPRFIPAAYGGRFLPVQMGGGGCGGHSHGGACYAACTVDRTGVRYRHY